MTEKTSLSKSRDRTKAVKNRKRGRPKGRISGSTKAKLREASLELFSKDNFEMVTIEMITRAANVSRTAFYNHYKSKDHLFVETVSRIAENTATTFSDAAGNQGTWQARTSNILKTLLEFRRDDARYEMIANSALMQVTRNPERFQKITAAEQKMIAVFQRIIADARTAGELPEEVDVEKTGELLMWLILRGMGAMTIKQHDRAEIERIMQSFRLLLRLT